MDKTAAKTFARQLIGQTLEGWEIVSYINCGKSAIVLKAEQAGQLAAIKVFDPELVKNHGFAIQKERISREKSLVGKNHPNLVCILGGGHWKAKKLYYIIMEFLPWNNLADALPNIPVGLERSVISQVAAAAKFLEDLKICHRDIKPENIGISDGFKTVKLLDLGVLRPMGTRSITDGTHSKVFVGTLKYSPPEFLLREEEDSVDSWRAVTFYQLGGVLHDLIMRTTLFKEFETPYAQLVNAVQHQRPVIESKSVPPALVDLAKHCLLKPPDLRLQLVTWKDFEKEPEQQDSTAELKARILKRNLVSANSSDDGVASEDTSSAEERLRQYARDVENTCRLECIDNKEVFPPIEIHTADDGNNRKRVILQFDPSPQHGLSGHLRLDIIVESVDSVNNVGTIYAKACVQSAASDCGVALKTPEVKLFTGIYSETVRASIAATLYRALDLAQHDLKSAKPHKGVSYSHALNLEDKSS